MKRGNIIVIGAGPAGLSAGFYSAYYNFSTMIFEENILGGEAAEIPFLDNYPGYDKKITGKELTDKMVQQCKETGGDIHQFEKAVELDFEGKQKFVKTEKFEYSAESVIIASGTHPKVLEVPGKDQFRGRGVSYCAVCDGAFFKNKRVIIVGEDSRAAEVAIYLSDIASITKLVCQKDKLCAEKILIDSLEKHNVEIIKGMKLKEIKGELNVKSILLSGKETESTKEIDTDGVFFQLEGIPNSQLVGESNIKVDDNGYILVDKKNMTNINNVYAVGDVTDCSVKLVSTAVSQAAVAVMDIVEHNNKSF